MGSATEVFPAGLFFKNWKVNDILKLTKARIPLLTLASPLCQIAYRQYTQKIIFLNSFIINLHFLLYQLIIKYSFAVCNCSKSKNIIKSSYGITSKTEAKSM